MYLYQAGHHTSSIVGTITGMFGAIRLAVSRSSCATAAKKRSTVAI
jgi:hypothetical protein